jgi:hypothetical protein
MKKYLLLLIIFLLAFKFGSSQTNVYHPFPDSSAIWIGTSWYNVGGIGPCVVDNDYNLYISGDTTIGTSTYHKLSRNGFVSAFMCPPPGYYYYGQYAGAFRQDTANKKVYLFQNGTDALAYDFNLNVGDTLHTSCLSGCNDNHIQSIDSVLIGSQYRKRFWISGCGTTNYTALIEGVGSTLGAFATIAPPFESGENLWCVRINNQIVWSYDMQGGNCGLTSINELSKNGTKLSISPNPFSSSTTLHTDKVFENATLIVYNSLGQQVKQIKNINGQTITLQRDNLPSGLYFIRLITPSPEGEGRAEVVATDKLVITD